MVALTKSLVTSIAYCYALNAFNEVHRICKLLVKIDFCVVLTNFILIESYALLRVEHGEDALHQPSFLFLNSL